MSTNTINECVERLEKESNWTYEDKDFEELVNYANCFLKPFGKGRLYLAGSTADRLKVKTNKDGGDTDILFISGKLDIPADNIEFREDTPCFIHIKVDKAMINKTIGRLIDGNYLSPRVLRSVGREFFSPLRCIYLVFKCATSFTPRNIVDTTFHNASKVGLALNGYKDLKVEEGMSTVYKRCLPKRDVKSHNESFKAYLKKRQSENKFNKQDVEIVKKVIEFMSYIMIQGFADDNKLTLLYSTGENRLKTLEDFAYLFSLLQERLNASSLEESLGKFDDSDVNVGAVIFEYDLESASDDQSLPDGTHVSNGLMDRKTSERNIHATCTRIRHIDIVPALTIIGPLEYMETWKTAEHLWLTQDEVDVIAKMDVFCVARYAPVNPSNKDFCLSFTLAEKKLTECLSEAQRHIMLILKAFLKGIFTKIHAQRVLKLTTFHVKTVIYRVSDDTAKSLWSEVSVESNLTRVLKYLHKALENKTLLHYFMPSNLFAGFEDKDFEILLKCTDEVTSDPLGGLQAFFKLDDGKPIDLWLTEEEVTNLERNTTDDGISDVVDIVQDFIKEFLRASEERRRENPGHTPTIEAFKTVFQLFLSHIPQPLANTIEVSMLTFLEKLLKPGGSIPEENKRLAFQSIKKIIEAYKLL